jgi:hypothetical protein
MGTRIFLNNVSQIAYEQGVMNSRTVCVCWFFAAISPLKAQLSAPSVVGSGGRSATSGNVCLQYTVGETVISPPASPTVQLAAGFQRPGAYDFWVTTFNVVGGPSGDPDGDGISNLMEYAVGSDPLSASSGRRPVAYITLTKGAGAGDVIWRAEASSDLLTWSEQFITVALNDAGTFSALYTGSPGRIYLRLRAIADGGK